MRLRFLVLILLLPAGGCGPKVAPVSGKVTLDDRPLANATVVFMPDSDQLNPGPGSKAKTDQNGQYSLELMTGDAKGAILGKHKVSITAFDELGNDGKPAHEKFFGRPLIPAEYNVQTKLTFDVPPGGSTSANFDLKSDADTMKK